MLKKFRLPNGRTYQYEEGKQPDGAVEIKAVEPPKTKAVKPANKSRKAVKEK